MEKTKFDSKNVMRLEIKTESGKCAVEVDLDFLTKAERRSLFSVVQQPQKGGQVGFGMQPGPDEDTVQIIFSLPNPMRRTLAGKIHSELVN